MGVLRPLLLSALLSLLLIALPRHAAAQEAEVPLVYAAASLTDVLQQIAADYSRERQRSVRLSFGSTATLARQIEAGARADLFVAADEDWMDYVEQRGLVRRSSRLPLLGNSLVLIAPASSTTQVSLQRGVDLGAVLGKRGRLALADPASVPAGKYAKAALSSLGAWQSVEPRIVAGDNVRMALLYVARGEAPLGVVYATDAQAEPRVRVVAQFPRESHPPIVYPVALTTQARPGTGAFFEYLAGSTARARFEAAGFVVLADARAPSLACRVGERDVDTEIRLFQREARPAGAGDDHAGGSSGLAGGTAGTDGTGETDDGDDTDDVSDASDTRGTGNARDTSDVDSARATAAAGNANPTADTMMPTGRVVRQTTADHQRTHGPVAATTMYGPASCPACRRCPDKPSMRSPICCCTTSARAWPTSVPMAPPPAASGARRRSGVWG